MRDSVSIGAQVDAFVAAYLRLLREAPDSGDADIEAERRVFAGLLCSKGESALLVGEALAKPVCRFLEQAHKPSNGPMMAAVSETSLPLARQATWRNKYRRIPGRESLFDNFAYCDYVGPEGWIRTEDVTLGLTLLGPETNYPFHQHPARELYFLLSGRSTWAVDFRDHVVREPGTWILHKEMQPHAIRSLETPMLAISAWRGAIHARSQFCIQEAKRY